MTVRVLREQPEKIGNTFLERYPSYIAFRDKGLKNRKARAKASTEEVVAIETQTPEELLESSHDALRSALADELLEQLHGSSWKFFEKIVVEVLVAMGYGGSIEDAGQAMCKSNDGGIDGVIKEDRLGLDVVVVQAKQWKEEHSVGRPEVQGFAGSMEPYRARKGVFITTSTFSKLACDYVKECERKIVLIDGTALANYMIDFDVGVTTYKTYMVKRVDSDFFEE